MKDYFNLTETKAKKEFLVFDGQNASTGAPHPITGRMSFWGDFRNFSSKEKRQQFIDKHQRYTGDIIVAGTRRTLRKYSLGCSLAAYNAWLDYLDYE